MRKSIEAVFGSRKGRRKELCFGRIFGLFDRTHLLQIQVSEMYFKGAKCLNMCRYIYIYIYIYIYYTFALEIRMLVSNLYSVILIMINIKILL